MQTIPYLVPDSVFVGAAYSPDGSQAYVAGGGFDVLHTFSVGTEGSSLRRRHPDRHHEAEPLSDGCQRQPGRPAAGCSQQPRQHPRPGRPEVAPDHCDDSGRPLPYGALFSRDGKTIYISNWADAALSVLDAATHAVTATIKLATDRLSNLTPWARLRMRSRAQVNVGRSAQGASRGSG